MSEATIVLEHVGRRFPPAFDALHDVSLSIASGERVALMGPSGSGKSTLLNIVGLLDRPSSGRYLLDGEDTYRRSEREVTRFRGQLIGFVFQAFHLVPHLTVLENVELGLFYANEDPRACEDIAVTHLERVGMKHRLEAFPPTLSGGERQRVAIARARAKSPRLLLCDEPTGNLDSQTSERVLDELFSATAVESVLIVVTHNREVAQRADRVLTIRDGTLAS